MSFRRLYFVPLVILCGKILFCHGLTFGGTVVGTIDSRIGSITTNKVSKKLDSLVLHQCPSSSSKQKKILLVDGNNLRGISRATRWDHIEIQHRIEQYCKLQDLDLSILVWDHGTIPFVIPTNDRSVILFSGLSQRADDILVNEVDQLLQGDAETSLAVVTNDVELTHRIRKRFLSVNPSVSSRTLHLTLDSTGFVEVLNNLKAELSNDEERIQQSLRETEGAISKFRSKLRHGLASRREKTWERVVLAEVLRRSLSEVYRPNEVDESISPYVQNLTARGFRTTPLGQIDSTMPFQGPSRLDKLQRRTLQRFNNILAQSRKTPPNITVS